MGLVVLDLSYVRIRRRNWKVYEENTLDRLRLAQHGTACARCGASGLILVWRKQRGLNLKISVKDIA